MGNQNDDEALDFMVACGFDREESRKALKETNNDAARAIEVLTNRNQAHYSDPSKQIIPYEQSNAGQVPAAQSQQPAASSDDALQKAMEESKNEQAAKENMEVLRAIAMSLEPGSSQAQPMDVDNVGAPKLSEEERLMNQAIEQSLQVTSGDGNTTENPSAIKREPGAPVGLKNVGNTCYVNSLLQTYFMIPALRNSVLRYTPKLQVQVDGQTQQLNKLDEDTVDFMKELQRLFAYLILTNKSFVDPSQLLKKLKDRSGNPLKIGNQEDVSEFNDLFLENVERGLKLDFATVGETSEFVKKLFYGTSTQFITGYEEDQTPFEVQNSSVFNHLILRVGTELPDLFASLDSYVCDTYDDFTTEKGSKTRAIGVTWFKEIPPVLMFQQSRVDFDQTSKTYKKSVAPLVFDKEIWMDRYLVENRAETTAIRARVAQLNAELANLESQLASYTRYKGREHSLDAALASVMDYLKDRHAAGSLDPAHASGMLDILGRCLDDETNNMQALRDKIAYLRQHISTAYDHMKSHPYTLFAVWVHQGVAGSGHYWAFLRDPRTDSWIRFNDMRTSPVSEADVMKESIGGHANSSAYFLLYVNKYTVDSIPFREGDHLLKVGQDEALTLIPEPLKQEISEANAKFVEAVENHEKNSSDVKVKNFVDAYRKKFDEVVKNSNDISQDHDYRIKSLWTFMCTQGMHDLAHSDLLQEMYSFTFERGLSHDVDSEVYRKVSDVVGKDQLEAAKSIAGDSSRVEVVRMEHRNFQDVVQKCCNAMDAIIQKKYSEAGNMLLNALQRDRELPYHNAHRESDIFFLIKIVVQSVLVEVDNKLTQGRFTEAITDLRDAVGYMLSIGTSDSLMPTVKNRLAQWGATYPQTATAVAAFSRIIQLTGNTVRPPLQNRPPLQPAPKVSSEEGGDMMNRYATTFKRISTDFFQVFTMGMLSR